MEKTSAIVLTLAILVAGIIVSLMVMFGHEDNNREKQVVITCIQSGGEPIYEGRSESMKGCERDGNS